MAEKFWRKRRKRDGLDGRRNGKERRKRDGQNGGTDKDGRRNGRKKAEERWTKWEDRQRLERQGDERVDMIRRARRGGRRKEAAS